MKMNILITKLLAAFLFVTPLVANASVVVYAYKGSSTTTGGNRSIVIAHTGTLVLDADPNSEAYLSGTYVGQFSLGSGKNKRNYFISRTFEVDVSQVRGPKGSSYTILAKAETSGSDYTGSVLHFENAKGLNCLLTIKTNEPKLSLPKTLASKAYIITEIITEDGSDDYATETSGAYTFDKVKTVVHNDAGTSLSDAVSALEETYKAKIYQQWDANIWPGMPTPTPTPDDAAPVITLKGNNPMTISVGESFTDPGADVSDNVDVARVISGNGTVNPNLPGTYTLTYSASDAAGNAATAVTRSVVVSSIVSVAGGTLPSGSQLSGQTVAAFQIGVCEVTYSEWQSVCANAAASGYTDLDAGAGVGNYPVTNVSWYAAVKWCNAKSEQEGLTPVYTLNGTTYKTGSPSDSDPLPTVNTNANGYRLPTEKEWEWAARGGVQSLAFTYSGSNVAGEVAWAYENSANTSHPVGTKQQNELGIYDMSGNVWEWCQDLVSGMSKRRRRGGAFNYLYTRSSMSSRSSDYDSPSMRESDIGFRVAKNSAN